MTRQPIDAAGITTVTIPVRIPDGRVLDFEFRTNIGARMLRTLSAIANADRRDRDSTIDAINMLLDHLRQTVMGEHADTMRQLIDDDMLPVDAAAAIFHAVREEASPLDPTQPKSSPDGSSGSGSSSMGGAPLGASMPPPSTTGAS